MPRRWCPGRDWRATHSFGLGGLFGDTVWARLLTLLPIGSTSGAQAAVVADGLGHVGAWPPLCWALPVPNCARLARFLLVGVDHGLCGADDPVGRGASRCVRVQAPRRMQDRHAPNARDAARLAAEAAGLNDRVLHADRRRVLRHRTSAEPMDLAPEPRRRERGGLLSRLPVADPAARADAGTGTGRTRGRSQDVTTMPGADRIRTRSPMRSRIAVHPDRTPQPRSGPPADQGRADAARIRWF